MNPDNKDHLRAMLAAYNKEVGLELPFIPERERILRAIHRLGHGPDEVTAVLKELKRLVNDDPRRYTIACLDFRNAIARLEQFDNRVHKLKARAAKASAPKRAPAPTRPTTSADEARRLADDAKRRSAELKEQLYGGPKT